MTVFKRADDEDRAGRANVATARTFYVAANLFDVMKQVCRGRGRGGGAGRGGAGLLVVVAVVVVPPGDASPAVR